VVHLTKVHVSYFHHLATDIVVVRELFHFNLLVPNMPGFDMLHCIVCYGPCLHVVNYDTMHVYLLNCLTDLNKYLTCFWIFGFPSGISIGTLYLKFIQDYVLFRVQF
jgi:hypothetical protein